MTKRHSGMRPTLAEVTAAGRPCSSAGGIIKHIVWDWNGTLIDDVSACVRSLNDMLRRYGLAPVTVAQYRARFGFPVQDYYVKLGFDFTRHDWTRVASEFHAFYRIHSKRARLRKGVRRILEELAVRGIAMSVLSASELSILESMISGRGIRRFFSNLHGLPDQYASSKLDAGRRMLSVMDVDASNLLLVGDTEHDCEVAAELRCRCVLVSGGHQSTSRLRDCGCTVLPDVESVVRMVDRERSASGRRSAGHSSM